MGLVREGYGVMSAERLVGGGVVGRAGDPRQRFFEGRGRGRWWEEEEEDRCDRRNRREG